MAEKDMYKLLEAVVLGQLSKGRRTAAIEARKGRRKAGQEALEKLETAKKNSPSGPEWHNLSPAAKAARKKAMGFGVGKEKKSKKKKYTIVRNSHTDPDTMYKREGQYPYIYIADSNTLFVKGSTYSTDTHYDLISERIEDIIGAIDEDSELAEIIMSDSGYSSYDELLSAAQDRNYSLINVVSDLGGSVAGSELGMINGRYLNNETSVWTYADDRDVNNIIKLLNKRGDDVDTFHVPAEQSDQRRGFGDTGYEGGVGSERESREVASLYNEPKKLSKSKTKESEVGWMSPVGKYEGAKSIAEKKSGARNLGQKGYIRIHLFNDTAKSVGVQFYLDNTTKRALENTRLKLKEYDAKYISLQYGAKGEKPTTKIFDHRWFSFNVYIDEMIKKVVDKKVDQKQSLNGISVGDTVKITGVKIGVLKKNNGKFGEVIKIIGDKFEIAVWGEKHWYNKGEIELTQSNNKKKKSSKKKSMAASTNWKGCGLDNFLEGVQNTKLEEGVVLRDVADIKTLIKRIGFKNFILSLIGLFEHNNMPVEEIEAVVDYLREILRLQKK